MVLTKTKIQLLKSTQRRDSARYNCEHIVSTQFICFSSLETKDKILNFYWVSSTAFITEVFDVLVHLSTSYTALHTHVNKMNFAKIGL